MSLKLGDSHDLRESPLEKGFKKISSESISKIRQGGSSCSFDFREAGPSAPAVGETTSPVFNPSSRQVGVIKPIARDKDTDVSARNAINVDKNTNKSGEEKEVMYIEKDPPLAFKSWKEIAAERSASQARIQQQRPYVAKEEAKSEPGRDAGRQSAISPKASQPEGVDHTAYQAKPDQRQHQKQKHQEQRSSDSSKAESVKENQFPMAREASSKDEEAESKIHLTKDDLSGATSETKPESSVATPSDTVNNDNAGGKSYRDEWKKRNSEQNSMVFNFVNTDRETSHIENDGRDISRRTRSKKGKRNLSKVSQENEVHGIRIHSFIRARFMFRLR